MSWDGGIIVRSHNHMLFTLLSQIRTMKKIVKCTNSKISRSSSSSPKKISLSAENQPALVTAKVTTERNPRTVISPNSLSTRGRKFRVATSSRCSFTNSKVMVRKMRTRTIHVTMVTSSSCKNREVGRWQRQIGILTFALPCFKIQTVASNHPHLPMTDQNLLLPPPPLHPLPRGIDESSALPFWQIEKGAETGWPIQWHIPRSRSEDMASKWANIKIKK